MTDKEKQFNQWFDEYADGVKVFEEADMKQAYLQGRAELENENKVLAHNLEDTEIINNTLEKENAELKADNDARKFAMAMSEKVEKQLREEIAELKKQLEMSNKVYNDNLDYSHHIEGQLTKAKEIIKAFLDSSDLNIKHKAEEFLGEF